MNQNKHRFFDKVIQARQEGIVRFFLHGENINEDWFYNDYIGVQDAKTSLVFNLLYPPHETDRLDQVLVFSRDGVVLFQRSEAKKGIPKDPLNITPLAPKDIRPTMLGVRNRNTSVLGGARSGQEAETQPENPEENAPHQAAAQDAAQNAASSELLRSLKFITEVFREKKEPVAVIIDGLKWIAELFPGREHKLEYLEEIEKWSHISDIPHLSFILIESVDLLKNYFPVSEEHSGVIYAGGPSVREIRRAFERSENTGNITAETLDIAATAVKNSGKLLLHAVHLFAEIRKSLGSEFYDTETMIRTFRDRLNTPIETIKWDDVYLNNNIRQEIENTFDRFLKADDEERKKLPKGYLFHGPPGTGKTMIAKALANRGGFFFMAPKLADIKGQYVGTSGKNVQRIFSEARAGSPTLLFLDELDTLFTRRGSQNQDNFSTDIINQFLAEVDGVDTGRQEIFIIGATNRLEILDDAVKSRLVSLRIDLPDAQNREKMFVKGMKLNPDQHRDTVREMVRRSQGLSGRDIKTLNNHMEQLVRNRNIPLHMAQEQTFIWFKQTLTDGMRSPSFNAVSCEQNPFQGFDSIIGYEQAKNRLRQVVHTVLQNQRARDFGLEDYNGILLYGPPGNGKTCFAEAVSKEFSLDFVKVVGSSLAAGYADGMIRQLDEIVDKTVKLSAFNGVLLFFDEFDSIASSRMDIKFRGALLDSITSLRRNSSIILMAATNFYNAIDEAAKRPGRFDEHILFPNPSEKEQKDMLKRFLTSDSRFRADQVDHDRILHHLNPENTSISSIKIFCNNARRTALFDKRNAGAEVVVVTNEHFLEKNYDTAQNN